MEKVGDGDGIETSTTSKWRIDEENSGYIRIKVWWEKKTMGQRRDVESGIIEDDEVSNTLKYEVRYIFDFWWGMWTRDGRCVVLVKWQTTDF